ncbi:hypothetical protein CEXT_479081 [Caerostris extrusa]|uniref:Uncharacterized protein n=1 Tax=Caerostris extrusa TaxID=172846 RepID=A0AAV4UL64_CAEEX|nr:hypothetical protein CEXT_479081 [Caerostris extrusa]
MQMRFEFQTISPDIISETVKALCESAAKCSEAPCLELPRNSHISAGDPVSNERDLRASAPVSSPCIKLFREKCTSPRSAVKAPRPDLPRHAHTILAEDPVSNERDRRALHRLQVVVQKLFREKCIYESPEMKCSEAPRPDLSRHAHIFAEGRSRTKGIAWLLRRLQVLVETCLEKSARKHASEAQI